MNYHIFPPSAPLKNYIEQYYIFEHEAYLEVEYEISSTATCYSALVFNFGTPYRFQNSLGDDYITPPYFMGGFSTGTFRVFPKGKINMLGIVFKGTGLLSLFPSIRLECLHNKRASFVEMLGSEAEIIAEQLEKTADAKDQIATIDSYLLNRLERFGQPPSLADKAALLILRKRGMITIEKVAETLNVGDRHLRRVFSERLGMNPKLFARIKRFQYVNLCLTQNETLDWQEFLDEGGFYDQAHFIKDFVAFCGKAPSAQLLQSRQISELLTPKEPA